jgi:hypothetical protein
MSVSHLIASAFAAQLFPEEEETIPTFTFGSFTSCGDYTIRFADWEPSTSLEEFLADCTVVPKCYKVGTPGMREGAYKHHRVLEYRDRGGRLVMQIIEKSAGKSED